MANTRWIVCKMKSFGVTRIVRARESQEVIGGLIPTPGRGGYLATRAESGEDRHFNTRFDACAWLMDGHDAAVDSNYAKSLEKPALKVVA